MGWLFTSILGPTEDVFVAEQHVPFDTSSAGVLSEPSGFGLHKTKEKRPGIIGTDDGTDDAKDEGENGKEIKEPSVSGALAELHDAVSHKIQSWNPYFAKGSKAKGAVTNNTSIVKGAKHNSSHVLAGEFIKEGISEEDRLGARIRIGKCTVLFYGNNFWERCIRTHEQHDKVNGYRLHVLRQQLVDDVWSKPAYILSLLLRELAKPEPERLEWLLWVDADTIILNPNVPIETFLPPAGTEFDDVHLMYTNDMNGLNNGVFPVRVNQWAVKLFSAIVAFRHYKPDVGLQFRDQSAMSMLMQEPEFSKHIVQAPQRWFNAYQGEHNETLAPFQIRRGDLLVHFAGVPAREERMQYWLQRAEQHLDDWEVPVKSTSYPQEARDFWNEERDRRRQRMDKVVETRKKAQDMLSQTDQRMNDFGDRLDDEHKAKIEQAKERLQNPFDDPALQEDVKKLEEKMKDLEEAAKALLDVVTDSNKLLLQSAHEAIFGGERDMLENGFKDGDSDSELERISSAVKGLKALVVKPEDSWNRNEISQATNAVTEARANLKERLDTQIAAKKKEEDDQRALEEAKLAAQKEADAYAAGDGGDFEIEDNEHETSGDGEDGVSTGGGQEKAGEDDELDDEQMQADMPSSVDVVGVTITEPGPVTWVTAFVPAAGEADEADAKGDDDS
jgi:hypothetical protein